MKLGVQENQGNSRSQGTGSEKRESHTGMCTGSHSGIMCVRVHTHKTRPGKTTWKDYREQSAKFAQGQLLFPPARIENLVIHGVSSKMSQ